jgi:formylglycine-generating enzyme required for sulfatase activity
VYFQPTAQGPADITNAGGLSQYGTMAQNGNVWEWNESAYDGSNDNVSEPRELRGGSWFVNSFDLVASSRYDFDPTLENGSFGFRVASVPEPASGLLVLLGLSAVLRRRRKPGSL